MFAEVIVDIANPGVDRLFEYRVPEGMDIKAGYRVKVPFGKANALREGYVLKLSRERTYEQGELKSIDCALSDFPVFTEGQIKLAYMMRRFYHTTLASALRLMYPAQMRGGKVKDRFERRIIYRLSEEEYEKAKKTFYTASGSIRSPRQLEVLEAMREKKQLFYHELERLIPGSASARDALLKKGFLASEKVESLRAPRRDVPGESEFELSEDQKNAVETITSERGKYLLHGVTGSGKTEVYIKIVKDCLLKGKSAIVLVPEISLTPQLVSMFERRIGEHIAVYHSTLSAGERYGEWKLMATGRTRVVIGARSAVFAPMKDIGVIIIDEEHETTYRSDMSPKYTAHEIARMRCNIEGATLVLASATPSVESYIKAKNGIYRLVRMPSRLFGLKLPEVLVADMRKEITLGNRTIFSGLLYNEMRQALSAEKQVMLFLNRRGYSSFVMCRGCGFVECCDSCAVSMTYHASVGSLVCHYCGRKRATREVCPVCGMKYLKQFGIGTQQVEEQVKKHFPGARALRMDLDTTRGKDSHSKIYERFSKGEADILIGTQMIAKGLDFWNVSLVGIVAADISLHVPDFRSAERTFQLLEQVAGRSGRKDPGKVVVQTYSPEHYAVEFARTHDFEGFFNREMGVRRSALLPPYSVFIRIVFAGVDERKTMEACVDYGNGLKEKLEKFAGHIPLFDINEAPVKKLEGKSRWQVIIKALNDEKLADIRKTIYSYSDEKQYEGCAFGLEINPQSMI